MTGDLVPFPGSWRDLVDAQLAELNTQATATLDRTVPAPNGLPPTGSWIRAMKVDDDARGTPATPWHYVVGWDAPIGCLSTRCRRRAGRALDAALTRYLGEPSTQWWRGSSWERHTLVVEAERPDQGACRQCDVGLARDAAAETAADRAAELAALVELLPTVRAIAGDQSIDDAERGRRLRELWP